MVMYSGEAVECCDVHKLFKSPGHPYTVGLLRSIPKLTERVDKLYNIPGMVPSPGEYPEGCRFAPRCEKACQRCWKEKPQLREIEPGHWVRCLLCDEGGKNHE
ncbi:Glutathione import ATP-binding protein GsiA [uncultured Flavonifractor sp.]|nr:Glutathione import ATP-binding protein GsiA [uncultured Flavonifractor sp.]